jgi:methylthioribose-1-phosphate isomerase
MTMLRALPTVRFSRGRLCIIDQTLLPSRYEIAELPDLDSVCDAIVRLRVRGAPAIGVAGAYGLLVAIEEKWAKRGEPVFDSAIDADGLQRVGFANPPERLDAAALRATLEHAAHRIVSTRPTAVNLGWAVERMRARWLGQDHADAVCHHLIVEADSILREDLAMGRAMAEHGATLLADGDRVLTHCNTGSLATGGIGTALGAVFAAQARGRSVSVYADETRPLLQGARLTAWECRERGIPVTVLVDGAAASLLGSGGVSCVMVGADRIARNGDTANKVGTLPLAIAAREFEVPFYVIAPSSSVDRSRGDGSAIPLEHRAHHEVTHFAGAALAPADVDVYNPAFDVTPASFITAIVTERGIHRPPYDLGGAA